MNRKLLGPGLVLVGAAILYLFVLPNFKVKAHYYTDDIKSGAHAIQLALERYAIDHEAKHPEDIRLLADEAYLPTFPGNSYVRNPKERGLMRQVDFEDPDYLGNFTYLPIRDNSGKITNYELFAYGLLNGETGLRKPSPPGEAVQHIIILLSSATYKLDQAQNNARSLR